MWFTKPQLQASDCWIKRTQFWWEKVLMGVGGLGGVLANLTLTSDKKWLLLGLSHFVGDKVVSLFQMAIVA